MATTEFQSESSPGYQPHALTDEIRGDWWSHDKSRAPIQAMLLGLCLRGWLTASERRVLDLLAPRSVRTFLRLGKRTLHPENPDLLPADAVPDSLIAGTDAIFTRRWHPDEACETGNCRVHTADVGNIAEEELLFGLVEPEGDTGRDLPHDHFGRLVAQFRQALIGASAIAGDIRRRTAGSKAWILVNRTSGRVVDAGEASGLLLGLDRRALTDCEYSSLSGRLSLPATGRGLHMENLAYQDMHLAMVTILPERRSKPAPAEDKFFSEFFVHAMRNKLSAITTASSHLASLAGENGLADEGELASIILEQAVELDRQVDRLRLLLYYDQITGTPIAVGREIKAAAELAHKQFAADVKVDLSPDESDLTLELPAQSMGLLLDAAFRSHLSRSHRAGRTEAALTHEPNAAVIRLRSDFDADGPSAQFSSSWKDYTTRLAGAMGFSCLHQCPNSKVLTTTLTIPRERR